MEQQFALLKDFVQLCKVNPDILHHPQLGFYREFIESLGGKIPPRKAPEPEKAANKEAEAEPEPMDVPEEKNEIPYPELDMSGVIPADSGEPLPMGDHEKEPTDEDLEKASFEREQAIAALSDGDHEKAVSHFSAAIQLNPGSAILHAKRAQCLLALKRPVAALADCDEAIRINPDSAAGYKFRGRANRLLGKWVEAHTDLATACKIDYDDTANEWLKEVESNAKKVQEYNRCVARQKEEKELNERKERVRRAKEEHAKAAEEEQRRQREFPDLGGMGGMGGMGGGGMGAFADIFGDPEIQTAMKDPATMAALADVMQNPGNISKYLNNPVIMKLLAKMNQFGGPGGDPDMATDEPPRPASAPSPPPKAPEPDLD